MKNDFSKSRPFFALVLFLGVWIFSFAIFASEKDQAKNESAERIAVHFIICLGEEGSTYETCLASAKTEGSPSEMELWRHFEKRAADGIHLEGDLKGLLGYFGNEATVFEGKETKLKCNFFATKYLYVAMAQVAKIERSLGRSGSALSALNGCSEEAALSIAEEIILREGGALKVLRFFEEKMKKEKVHYYLKTHLSLLGVALRVVWRQGNLTEEEEDILLSIDSRGMN